VRVSEEKERKPSGLKAQSGQRRSIALATAELSVRHRRRRWVFNRFYGTVGA